MRVDAFPAPGTKAQASQFLITTGGQAGNAAVAAARLGAAVRYAGPIGSRDDEVANRIVATLEHEGIDCRYAVRVPDGLSSVSLIMIDAAGEKMIATRRGTNLGAVAPDDVRAPVADIDAVLLDNRYPDFVTPIAREAIARGIPRVLDFDRAGPLDDPLLKLCTHVIASADALRASTGLSDLAAGLEKLAAFYEGFLAVTDGPNGIDWLERGAIRHMDAFKIDAIDTLGAGDAFHGAFTVALAETADTAGAMRFAAAAAAIKCMRFGGLMGAATRAEVDAFLRERAG